MARIDEMREFEMNTLSRLSRVLGVAFAMALLVACLDDPGNNTDPDPEPEPLPEPEIHALSTYEAAVGDEIVFTGGWFSQNLPGGAEAQQ